MSEKPMTFADLLQAANQSRTGRAPGQWMGAACQAYRDADPDLARLLEAALTLEIRTGRVVRPGDEAIVRELLQDMERETARMRAKQKE